LRGRAAHLRCILGARTAHRSSYLRGRAAHLQCILRAHTAHRSSLICSAVSICAHTPRTNNMFYTHTAHWTPSFALARAAAGYLVLPAHGLMPRSLRFSPFTHPPVFPLRGSPYFPYFPSSPFRSGHVTALARSFGSNPPPALISTSLSHPQFNLK
jgi:hypothetical protein